KQIGQMLAPDAAARIQLAVEAARESATKIVKAGELAAVEIDLRAIRTVTENRTAFLDLDEVQDVAAPKQAARSLDLDSSVREASEAYVAKAREIELVTSDGTVPSTKRPRGIHPGAASPRNHRHLNGAYHGLRYQANEKSNPDRT